jgi:hypothetical protein
MSKLRYDRLKKPRQSDRLFEKNLDFPQVFPITPEHYKNPLPAEKWLERANYAFRTGIPDFHIPRSDIFYIKALIKEKLGYDLPVLYVEQLLIQEGMIERPEIKVSKVAT